RLFSSLLERRGIGLCDRLRRLLDAALHLRQSTHGFSKRSYQAFRAANTWICAMPLSSACFSTSPTACRCNKVGRSDHANLRRAVVPKPRCCCLIYFL